MILFIKQANIIAKLNDDNWTFINILLFCNRETKIHILDRLNVRKIEVSLSPRVFSLHKAASVYVCHNLCLQNLYKWQKFHCNIIISCDTHKEISAMKNTLRSTREEAPAKKHTRCDSPYSSYSETFMSYLNKGQWRTDQDYSMKVHIAINLFPVLCVCRHQLNRTKTTKT